MRTIERATQFRRDFKREQTGRHAAVIEQALRDVIAMLARDQPLPQRYQDHALRGKWAGYRDCHLKPDLILIYQKAEPNVLRLRRLASHADVFKT